MERDAVAIAEKVFSVFDAEDLSAWSALWHEDAVSTAAEGWPERGPFLGKEATVRQFQRLFEDWSDYRFEDVRIESYSADWALAEWTLWARGAGSGLEVNMDLVASFRVEDGLVREGHFAWTREEALRAGGLG